MNLGNILSVWAHPDDETYLSAGLMSDAVAHDHRVVCVTATRGELGSWDEKRWPTATLGAVRQAELEAAFEILGITEHQWLDYGDGACDKVPFEEGVGRIQALFDNLAPDTVLTFGPEGMTGHTDHKAVSAWTTEAFRRSAKPGARLYYAVNTPEWRERYFEKMQKFNVFFEPGTPPIVEPDQLAISFAIPDELLDSKIKAFECHVSQLQGMIDAFGSDFFRGAFGAENYVLAATA